MDATPLLELSDLHACAGDVAIARGIELAIHPGEFHVLVGPESAHNSALAHVLAGTPEHRLTQGSVYLDGEDISLWGPEIRSKAGMFLAFAQPIGFPGVSLLDFSTQALAERTGTEQTVRDLQRRITHWIDRLGIDPAIGDHHLNDTGVAGPMFLGELLQMAILEPDMAVLDLSTAVTADETIRAIAGALSEVRRSRPRLGVLAMTDRADFVAELGPDQVHIIVDGRIVACGGTELAAQLEREGYEAFQ